MVYNRINLLKRIIKIQDIVKEHTRRGVSQIWVYKNVVKDTYCISYSTFNNYLAYPAGMELKRLQKEKERQLTIF